MTVQANWEQTAKEKQKAYKRLLEKGNRNKMLKVLPALHEEAFSKIDCLDCANCCRNYSPALSNPILSALPNACA